MLQILIPDLTQPRWLRAANRLVDCDAVIHGRGVQYRADAIRQCLPGWDGGQRGDQQNDAQIGVVSNHALSCFNAFENR